MQLAAIRTAIAGISVTGFKGYRSAVEVGDLPAIVVGQPTSIVYGTDYGGTSLITLPVRCIVPRADEASAQDALDAAMSIGHDGSVADALLALLGPWKHFTVLNVGEPVGITVGNAEAVEVVFTCEINARRSE